MLADQRSVGYSVSVFAHVRNDPCGFHEMCDFHALNEERNSETFGFRRGSRIFVVEFGLAARGFMVLPLALSGGKP